MRIKISTINNGTHTSIVDPCPKSLTKPRKDPISKREIHAAVISPKSRPTTRKGGTPNRRVKTISRNQAFSIFPMMILELPFRLNHAIAQRSTAQACLLISVLMILVQVMHSQPNM